MNEKAFFPRLSEEGKKHPVTRGLEGAANEPPAWGRWFRTVDVDRPLGQTVMQAADGKPLLVLNRVGKGRVAMPARYFLQHRLFRALGQIDFRPQL